MSQEKRSAALVHAVAAVLFGVALSACSAGTYTTVSVQTPDAATPIPSPAFLKSS